MNCPSLASITIPSSVTNIDSGAFDGNIKIYGSSNSYAETYAKNHKMTFKLSGNELYATAYFTVSTALNDKSQKSINDARKAIEALMDTGAAWAVGEFSKQVDQVQQPILVKIIDSINKADSSLKQADINTENALIKDIETATDSSIVQWVDTNVKGQQGTI